MKLITLQQIVITAALQIHVACCSAALADSDLELVAQFDRDQPAGVAVSDAMRIFVTFPRHTGKVDFTVGEIRNGSTVPFPDLEINTPQSVRPTQTLFSVQSLVIDGANHLWMLDTGVMKVGQPPVPGAPKLVVVDLPTNSVIRIVPIPKESLVQNSALKDFRIDFHRGLGGTVYLTDSAPRAEGLIVIDLASDHAMRRLGGSAIVSPGKGAVPIVEGEPLQVRSEDEIPHPFAVGLNGVELSSDGETIYLNAFTGRHLFAGNAHDVADPAVPDSRLSSEISEIASVGVAGHLAIDDNGGLYVMDMERNAILKREPGGNFHVLVSSSRLIWPDTMAVGPDNYLYVTSSQHNRGPLFHSGADFRQRPFSLYRVWIGANPVRP